VTGVTTAPEAFDVCGPLPPPGVTVLEASAGTGKTFTIAALAARYVADGTPLRELLLVTFTRMATGELRERVRERLVSAEQGLSQALAGAPADDADAVVSLLADGTPEEVELRRDRLARAIAGFDEATIATTHGFCQEALASLGVMADVDPGATFVETIDDLRDEVVDDFYVRRWFKRDAPAFKRDEAQVLARIADGNPGTRLEPSSADTREDIEGIRWSFATNVRKAIEARKRQLSVFTYDDLLTRLNRTLADDASAVERLRERYTVVLVDEFQDTDPVQWDIMRRAFAHPGGTLVLIGDPKQAIYAFRGADVYAYLAAVREAGTLKTLGVNWRSDQGLIDAYDALFGGTKLGHEGIAYATVRAPEENVAPRLRGAPVESPLRVRIVDRKASGILLTNYGYAQVGGAREHVARDLARDVVDLLSSGAEVEARPVEPGHVAVLVRKNVEAALIRDRLAEVGVPAVINGAGSVFATAEAEQWLRLLQALEQPASSLRAHAAALTPFLGWTAERVAGADEDAWEDVHRRLHQWARVLRTKGVAALAETITLTEQLPGRVLADANGERRLTDLRHVAQLLHAEATGGQLGCSALAAWLRERIAEAHRDTSDEERSRRLESDAEAVQVLTIHRSKGLEFPIVYCPFLWDVAGKLEKGKAIFFHDPEAGDERTIDVGPGGPDYDAHFDQHVLEERGEELRLAYVALTRARHQAVVWWAGSFGSRDSALGRLLFARDEDGNIAPNGSRTPADAAVHDRFLQLAAEAPGCVSVERAELGQEREWTAPPPDGANLCAATFDRTLDRRWRRTSYSDLTRDAHGAIGEDEAWVGSEPEEPVVDDEPRAASAVAPAAAVDDALRAVPSLLAGMPHGVRAGTFVHRVLERADFAAPDLEAELAEHVGAGIEDADPAEIVAGLSAMLETPLGPAVDGLRLRDVARQDRLDELTFELPLVGGDEPSGRLALGAIAGLLRRHLGDDDPLAGYAERLDDPALPEVVRGYLTGSLDLVARIDGPRFAVVDYKTNWLAAPGEPLSAWHYRPEALGAEMRRGHYGLQALLYTAALHRFLRWRIPGYDPARHIAGVLYLFVRGMTGPDTPVVDGTPCGVFAWTPPAALVEELSDLLDEGAA
jgi:exodeoxyribonuclease V beta subunit